MHVAMVISTPIPPEEGIGYYTYNLSAELERRGHRVTILTRGGLRGGSTEHDGIRVEQVPFIPAYPFHVDLHGFFVNRRLNRLEPPPDIVHTHTPLTPVVNVDVPVVSTIHTSVIEDAKQIRSLDRGAIANQIVTRVSSRRLIANQCREARKLATVAQSVKDELKEHFGISGIQVVGNGVNLAEFDTRMGTDSDLQPYGLFVGRLSYRKGISDLLDAWEQLPSENRIPLKIIGKGPLRERLEDQIRGTELEKDIEFLGHTPRDELIRLFTGATVFVVPSHYEGLPTVLLEAMAAQTPVISTSVSGALDVIDDGDNGLLVPPHDPGAMRDAILAVLKDEDLREQLAKRARDTIERGYTWDVVTERYLDIYRSAKES